MNPISSSAISTVASANPMMLARPTPQDRTKAMSPVADALGMTVDELGTALRGGTSLNQLAVSKGLSHDQLINAIKTGMQAVAPKGKTHAGRVSGGGDPDGDGDDDAAEAIASGREAGAATRPQLGVNAPNTALVDKVSSMLQMSASDLVDQLRSGTSLGDLAKSKGVSPDALLQTVGKGMVLNTYA